MIIRYDGGRSHTTNLTETRDSIRNRIHQLADGVESRQMAASITCKEYLVLVERARLAPGWM